MLGMILRNVIYINLLWHTYLDHSKDVFANVLRAFLFGLIALAPQARQFVLAGPVYVSESSIVTATGQNFVRRHASRFHISSICFPSLYLVMAATSSMISGCYEHNQQQYQNAINFQVVLSTMIDSF